MTHPHPRPHRDTIFVEQALILAHDAFPGDQYQMRLQAPECAACARPGSFVHLQCDPLLPLRRPISLMRVDREAGWVELLYKAVGEGTRLLASRKAGESISMMGPIGQPFKVNPERPRPILIGGGIGMPPMIFIAQSLVGDTRFHPFAILGSEVPFPFETIESGLPVAGVPNEVNGATPLLEEWGIPSRLASKQGFAGCLNGYVTDLARAHLAALSKGERDQVELFACGPHPMLEAVAKLAEEWNLPCQVSLEEFMACAVGGCAGCVVEIKTENGPAMKRVCVDGPVFDARSVF